VASLLIVLLLSGGAEMTAIFGMFSEFSLVHKDFSSEVDSYFIFAGFSSEVDSFIFAVFSFRVGELVLVCIELVRFFRGDTGDMGGRILNVVANSLTVVEAF